jgi:CRISPR-associated protein Csb1
LGGVVAKEIRRDAVLNLIALRALGSPEDPQKLQRYILGLALVAFIAPAELYLRAGCLLTGSPDRAAEKRTVFRNGKREPLALTEAEAVEFAQAAAKDFGVGADVETGFDPDAVKKAAEGGKKKGKK